MCTSTVCLEELNCLQKLDDATIVATIRSKEKISRRRKIFNFCSFEAILTHFTNNKIFNTTGYIGENVEISFRCGCLN